MPLTPYSSPVQSGSSAGLSQLNRPLRIFYASDSTPNAWFQSVRSNIWRNNLLLPLRDLGHEVIEFDFDLTQTFRNLDKNDPKQAAFIGRNRPKVTDALLGQITKAHIAKPIDLVFTYFYDACVEFAAIDTIRALGMKTVNWYCNGSYQLDLVREISPHYDACLVPEKFRLTDYKAMGAHPIYCQEAANPTFYHPVETAQDLDISFVGQAYGERPGLVKTLVDRGLDVHAFGLGWTNPNEKYLPRETFETINAIPLSRRHEALSDEEMVRTFSRSKINLGFSSCGETHRTGERVLQVRLRDFEVPMAGGFYLVEEMAELSEFFVPGREIGTYGNPEELVEKAVYFLEHEEERESIRRAGHARAMREHTWQQRFETVLPLVMGGH